MEATPGGNGLPLVKDYSPRRSMGGGGERAGARGQGSLGSRHACLHGGPLLSSTFDLHPVSKKICPWLCPSARLQEPQAPFSVCVPAHWSRLRAPCHRVVQGDAGEGCPGCQEESGCWVYVHQGQTKALSSRPSIIQHLQTSQNKSLLKE